MNITLDVLEKYRDLAKELIYKYGWCSWDDFWPKDTGYKNVSNKLQYFLVSLLLIEMRVLPIDFKGEMAALDLTGDFEEFMWDSLLETGDKIYSLLDEVLNACGWSMTVYDFNELMREHEGKSDMLKELVESEDVDAKDAKDCEKTFHGIIKMDYLQFYSVYVIRNKKIGKFLSYAESHEKVRDSEIGIFIQSIIESAVRPIDLHVPDSCEIIRKEDEIVSTFSFFYSDDGEELSAHHIEPARILLLGVLDCAINLALLLEVP